MSKTNISVVIAIAYILLYPFLSFFGVIQSSMIAGYCWFVSFWFVVFVWYWKVIMESSMRKITKALILIVAVLVLLYPHFTAYVKWYSYSRTGIIVDFVPPIIFQGLLALLMLFTWLKKTSRLEDR
jgi:hypothetical protein